MTLPSAAAPAKPPARTRAWRWLLRLDLLLLLIVVLAWGLPALLQAVLLAATVGQPRSQRPPRLGPGRQRTGPAEPGLDDAAVD